MLAFSGNDGGCVPETAAVVVLLALARKSSEIVVGIAEVRSMVDKEEEVEVLVVVEEMGGSSVSAAGSAVAAAGWVIVASV